MELVVSASNLLPIAPFWRSSSRATANQFTHFARRGVPTPGRALFSPFFTGRRCRQADEGRRQSSSGGATPHPCPLPVKYGERGPSMSQRITSLAARDAEHAK